MWLRFFTIVAISAVLAAMSQPSRAEKRAFVVGGNAYTNLPADRQLVKAINDARAVAGALERIGFGVTKVEDPTRADFNRAWQGFLNTVAAGDTIVVFYAGHGVQVGGLNYLLPRDVPKFSAHEEGLLRDESISLQKLMDEAKAKSPQLTLMIVDACRDNPFALPGGRSLGGAARGLARVEPPRGSFVILSAGAGETALDRLPGNDPELTSVFTRSLVPLLAQADMPLQRLAVSVREQVRQLASRAGHQQTPAYWDELSSASACLGGNCRDLAAAHASSKPQLQPAQPNLVTAEWMRLDKSSAAELEVFVRRNPAAPEADYAKARLEELRKVAPAPRVPQAPQAQPSSLPAAPSPSPTHPLATFENRGIAGTVRNARRGQNQIMLELELRNGSGQVIAIAAAEDPDGVGKMLSSDGSSCKVRLVQGMSSLWEADIDSARMTGNWDRLSQSLSELRPGANLTVTMLVSASDCEGPLRIRDVRTLLPIYLRSGSRIEKAGLLIPQVTLQGH
jgi:uncharacterized caspase-like protein